MGPPKWIPELAPTRKQAVTLLLVSLIVFVPVSYALVAVNTYSSGSTFETESGLTIQFNTAQTIGGNPFDGQKKFSGEGGTVEATNNGSGFLAIDDWGDGQTTSTQVSNLNATGTTAKVNPNTHDVLGLAGKADSVSWKNVTVDDNSTDLTITVPSSESADVTFYGVAPSQQHKLVDTGGSAVDRSVSTSSGAVTFDIPAGTHTLGLETYDDPLPTVTGLDPDNEQATNPITLRADVDDNSLPGPNVTVTFRLKGQVVHSENISSAQEVNYTLTSNELPGSGVHSWSVTAKDDIGNEKTSSASFTIPGNMTIRNVSNPDESVSGATATVYTEDGKITVTSDANGNLSLAALQSDGPFVMVIEHPNYTKRTTVIDSVVGADDAFLIPNGTDTVLDRFNLDDPTGKFGSDSRIYLERPLAVNNSTSYRVVAADEIGVEGFSATLKQGERYRVRIVSADGSQVRLGSFTADVSETVVIRPDSPAVTLEDAETLYYAANVTEGDLRVSYVDPTNTTEVLTISVVNRFNESDYLVTPDTYYGSNSFSMTETVGELSKSYIVVIEGQRNGESFEIRLPIGPKQLSLLPGELSLVWGQFIGAGLVLGVSGIFSRLNVSVGILATSLFGGVMWYLGFLGGVATAGAVSVAIVFAVLYGMVQK